MSLPDRDFENQWKTREKISTPYGTFNLTHIHPKRDSGPRPLLIIPGFAEGPDVFKRELELFHALGRETITLDYRRTNWRVFNYPKYPPALLATALGLIYICGEKRIKEVDGNAHSQGGIVQAIIGDLRPDLYRNVVFQGSAGLEIYKNSSKIANFAELMADYTTSHMINWIKMIQDPTSVKPLGQFSLDAVKHLSAHPIRGMKEAWEIATTDIQPWLANMVEAGVSIGFVHGVNDRVFRGSDVKNSLATIKDPKDLWKLKIKGFCTTIEDHTTLHVTQQPTLLADYMLRQMDNVR